VFGVCALAYPKTAGELVVLIAVTVTAGLLGMLVRSRRAQLGALRDRAAALERESPPPGARLKSGCGSRGTSMTWSVTR
jgi:hypothetical protein